MLRYAVLRGWNDVRFPGEKRFEDVRVNVISVTRGCVGDEFPEKKHYATLEWPDPLSWTEKFTKGEVLRKMGTCREILR